jgi:hypothetical protein
MKTTGARCLMAALFFASAILVFGNDFKSAIITSASPLSINVPDNHFLVIRNFTQEGGTSRGVVTVTDANSQTANVLTAAIIDTSTSTSVEVINTEIIAGPATVAVTCPADATSCVITYKRESE